MRIREEWSRLKGAVGVSLLLLLSGCQGAQYSLPSVTPEEIAVAQADIDASPPLSIKARGEYEARESLSSIAFRLQEAAAPICAEMQYPCSFSFIYEADSSVNAFSSGAQDITITSGLMAYLQNEDEIAAVVGHEMGHHIAGHLSKGYSNAKAGSILGGLLLGAVAIAGGGDAYAVQDLANSGANMGGKIGNISFSKEHEREADYLGAYIMARAGFDVVRGENVWLRLAKQPDADRETDIFDTHPADADRMAAWRRTIREIDASGDLMPHWGK